MNIFARLTDIRPRTAVERSGTGIVLCGLLLTVQAMANVQTVRPEPIVQSAAGGETISVDILYATDPETPDLTGLGLRLHWDSSRMSLESLNPATSTGLLGQSDAPEVDERDFDGNPDTDRFVVVAWADSEATWPGSDSTVLATATFELAGDFQGATSIGVSASSTPAGWELSDVPGTITDPDVGTPEAELVLDKEWQSTDGRPGIDFGGEAFFVLTATNPGLLGIDNIVIDDPLVPDCNRTIDRLLAGESTSWGCSTDNVIASFTNEAFAEGIALDDLATQVEADDSAPVTVLDPVIDLVIDPDFRMVRSGDGASFAITATNTSDEVLEDVVLASDTVPGCDLALEPLDPGASMTYSCSREGIQQSFDNVLTASALAGDPPESTVLNQVGAEVLLINPALALEKTASPNPAQVGSDVTFELTLANTGDIGLTDLEVVDPELPACDRTFSDLAAGASVSWTCTLEDIQEDLTNTATADAQPPVGEAVDAAAEVTVESYILVFRDDFEAD